MAHCVNRSSREFQELAEQTNINPVILAAKVSLWQEKHGLENFPEMRDIVPDVPVSVAPEETLRVMKAAAEKMGINIMAMSEYLKGNPEIPDSGVNAVADLMKKTIGIAEGMEGVALTEEIVHVATAMMEQTHPKLITELISKIDRFKIYKEVFDQYKNLKAYQLPGGKPNIRKIKKEAVDKLIAEVMINNTGQVSQFPELLEKGPSSIIKDWWNVILDYIRGLYRKSDLDVYQRAGEIVASGELDASITPSSNDIFYQVEANPAVDKMYDTIKAHANEMRLVDEDEVVGIRRHYLYKGVEALKSVTEKVKEKAGKMFNRTDEQKAFDEMKKNWGLKGHLLIERYFPILIDQNGYKREVPQEDNITSDLPEEVERQVKSFMRELVNSYKPGTRFLVENKVINTKVKGMLGGTVDLIILEPTEDKDGKPDVKADILDWKFTSLTSAEKEDIPWFKKKEWVAQMGEYTQILYNYGLKRNQLRKARMIPFIMNYEYALPGNPKSGLYPKSIEIGKLNSLEETNLYLLPVPINSETTGNPAVDNLIKSLREQYEKLYKSYVSPEEKDVKDHKLNEINKAIRNLQLRLNFAPLVDVANNFLESAAKDISEYEKINYNEISPEELKKVLLDLLSFINGAVKYQSLDSVYLSQYSKDDLTPEEKATFLKIEKIAARSVRMVDKINALQHEVVVTIATKEGIDLETFKAFDDTVRIKAEIPMTSLDKTFSEASRVNASLIQLTAQLTKVASKETNIKFREKMSEFRDILVPLETLARTKGKKAFDMIGTITPSGLRLIRKFDSKFWEEIKKAKSEGNKRALMEQMDMEKFNELAAEAIKKQIEYLEKVTWSSDEEENAHIQKSRIEKAKDAIDITRSTFDGYEGFKFGEILNKVLKEEGNLSKEYSEMVKTPEAFKVWEYFSQLNQHAKNMGYLSKNHSTSFFPLVEATTIQKFINSDNFFGQLASSIKDLGMTDIDESVNLSKIDPETGEVKKEIPKYFTASNKAVSELSTDLGKVGSLWIKSLMEYQKIESLESTLLTILAVEQNKGSIVVDKQNRIVDEDGEVKVREENPNAQYLETLIDDFAYGIREDLGSIGNVKLAEGVSKLSKTEEGKQASTVNVKKLIKNADIYVQSMAVGLKPLIGAANYGGAKLHAYINSGIFYKYSDFRKQNNRVLIPNSLSSLEKALAMKIVPNDGELMTLEQRKIAQEKGGMSWVNTWSFSDVMMITSSFPEHRLQLANALTFIENSMIVDGKIVPIRQYLLQKDRQEKYAPGVTEAQRKLIESTLDQRVEELKKTSSLLKTCTFEDGKLEIPGVSDREFTKFALLTTEYYRGLTGQMNPDDKAGYRRDTMINSFFMFKHWIPPLVSQRARDIQKNLVTNEWEYGRTRAFVKTWTHLGFRNVTRINQIIKGTDEGLRILDEMIEQKRIDYFKKTGKTLEITDEQFYDLMRSALNNEVKELKALLFLLGALFAVSMMEPPEESTDLDKNLYKYAYKGVSKLSDELSFYYNPLSFESMTKGSIIPAASIGARVVRFGKALVKETTGYVIDDDEMIDKNYPLKYFLNLVPGLYQLETEVLPYVSPETAKEMGIRVSAEARRQ